MLSGVGHGIDLTLDHTRDYFGNHDIDPRCISNDPTLAVSRWVTIYALPLCFWPGSVAMLSRKT